MARPRLQRTLEGFFGYVKRNQRPRRKPEQSAAAWLLPLPEAPFFSGRGTASRALGLRVHLPLKGSFAVRGENTP